MVVIRDESAWPVVKISLGEQFDMEAVQEYMAYWEALLARMTSFGMLMLQPGSRNERPAREVTGIYTNWCKEHKIEIASSCAGIAVVMPDAKLLALYKPVTAISTRKMYGCPGGAFSAEPEAMEWLNVLLESKEAIGK